MPEFFGHYRGELMTHINIRQALALASVSLAALMAASAAVAGTTVTYAPYIQPGDAGPLEDRDQIVVTWQTNETVPNPSAYLVQFGLGDNLYESVTQPSGRVVDNYLAADPSLPVPPTSYGAHTNYTAVLRNLMPNAVYSYRVTGPGLPPGGFTSWFPTRKTGDHFAFTVMGDEGYFPTNSGTTLRTDFFARIVHLMYNSGNISLPGQPPRPPGEFALNTGDNVYNTGSEDSYRDFWMPVWNSDVDSQDRGAPFIRSFKNYIVTGNHDIGGSGDFVNLLATAGAGPYAGQTGGGDALAYFNNYYFPLNGPTGVDPFYVLNGDTATYNGAFFSYSGTTYTSPAAAEAYRASTLVDSGTGPKRQIDHMNHYSFDYGNAHFVFLDADPHIFNAKLDGAALYAAPPDTFSPYPSVLRQWLINDLDASDKTWKIVVYHQPAFSSGNATMRNNQMRAVATLLQDHGVNIVYNGHEHNYQRTRPLRATAAVTNAVSETAPDVVAIDTVFDGLAYRVPDGVIHLVEGAGGNRDFDGNEPNPRGQTSITPSSCGSPRSLTAATARSRSSQTTRPTALTARNSCWTTPMTIRGRSTTPTPCKATVSSSRSVGLRRVRRRRSRCRCAAETCTACCAPVRRSRSESAGEAHRSGGVPLPLRTVGSGARHKASQEACAGHCHFRDRPFPLPVRIDFVSDAALHRQ